MTEDNKVVTHERFLSAASNTPSKESAPATNYSLDELVRSGDIHLQSCIEGVVLSSDTSGGRYIGDMTEEERKLYTEAYGIKKRMSELGGITVTDVVKSKMADLAKEAISAEIDAGLLGDFSGINSLRDSYGLETTIADVLRRKITEEEKQDLREVCVLDERYRAIMDYLWFVIKNRLGAQGYVCGVRQGWRIYSFDEKWVDELNRILGDARG